MGRHHQGGFMPPAGLLQQRKHFFGRFQIQIARGLIRQDNARFVCQGPCDRYPLLFAARQLLGEPAAAASKPQLPQKQLRALDALGLGNAVECHGKAHVFRHCQRGYQVEELKYKPQSTAPHPGKLILRETRERFPQQFDVSAGGPIQPADQVEQRRLARAAASHHHHELPRPNVQVAFFEDHVGAIGFLDADEANVGVSVSHG